MTASLKIRIFTLQIEVEVVSIHLCGASSSGRPGILFSAGTQDLRVRQHAGLAKCEASLEFDFEIRRQVSMRQNASARFMVPPFSNGLRSQQPILHLRSGLMTLDEPKSQIENRSSILYAIEFVDLSEINLSLLRTVYHWSRIELP